MNNSGYIPLWRKSLNNKVRQRDPTAWRVFETLLLIVDYDTGVWEGGRFQLIDLDGGTIKPSTLYSALKRLEKAKMITLTGNTRYSTISICKWEDYKISGNTNRQQQGNTSGNTSGNTLKRREEEKNIEIDTNVSIGTSHGNTDINELMQYWEQETGMPISSRVKANRYACKNLLTKHGREKVELLITGVAQSQTDQYAPRIADFTQLQTKLNDLLVWGRRKGKTNETAKF